MFEHKIFIIVSSTGAMTMATLAKDEIVEHCIVEIFKDFTEEYQEVIETILKYVKIRNLYILKIPFYQAKEEKFIEYAKVIKNNKKIIEDFNRNEFKGNLFDKKNEFIGEASSQILNLYPHHFQKNEMKVEIIDHGIMDSLVRVKNSKKKPNISKTKFFSKSYMKKFLYKIMNLPNINRVYRNEAEFLAGYTIAKVKGDTHSLVDYRKSVKIDYTLSDIGENIAEINKTLLIVTMREEFKGLKNILSQINHIDFIKLAKDLAERHIEKNQLIIIKFHPHLYNCLSYAEMRSYVNKILNDLKESGYHSYFWNDLFKEEVMGRIPTELLIEPLKINKIVGVSSSLFWSITAWDDSIEVISDCRDVQCFAKNAIELNENTNGKVKVFY